MVKSILNTINNLSFSSPQILILLMLKFSPNIAIYYLFLSKILTTTIPTTPPITFVIISVVSETPIDKIYCIVSKNKLTNKNIQKPNLTS